MSAHIGPLVPLKKWVGEGEKECGVRIRLRGKTYCIRSNYEEGKETINIQMCTMRGRAIGDADKACCFHQTAIPRLELVQVT